MSWVLRQVLPVHRFEAYAISGPDLFLGNEDFTIRHWNLMSRECVGMLQGHRGRITDLEFSEDWRALFSTSVDGRLLVWFSGKLIGEFLNKQRPSDTFGSPLFSVCYWQHKSQLFVGGTGQVLVFKIQWEFIEKSHQKTGVQRFNPVTRVKIHDDFIHRMIIAADKLVTASRDRCIGLIKMDHLLVVKKMHLRQGPGICSMWYDRKSGVIWIGTVDGKLHTVTPDGLLLQSEPMSSGAPLVSLAVENECGLVWVVLGDGRLKLMDPQSITTELTQYFAVLDERPVVGIEDPKCFGVHFDRKNRTMYAFFNDHYVHEFRFDDCAAKQTIAVGGAMRGLTVLEYRDTVENVQEQLRHGPVRMSDGKYIIGGSEELQVMRHEGRYTYTVVERKETVAQVTALTNSATFVAYGDEKGYVYAMKLSTTQMTRTQAPVRGVITSVHLTGTHIVVTAANGGWYVLSIEHFPGEPEGVSSREMAHNGAINSATFNRETGILLTAGSDGLVKTWVIAESLGARTTARSAFFVTADEMSMTETNIVDMRAFGEVTYIVWAHEADRWVTAHSDGRIRVWTTDAPNCENLVTIPLNVCRVTALAVDDPDVILAALDDKTIRCFMIHSGDLMKTMTGHKGAICAVAASRELNAYVSASWDNTIKIWGRYDPSLCLRPVSELQTARTETAAPTARRPVKPKTAFGQRKVNIFQPISIYEKKKQEIERKRRREMAEYDARMRTPAARELKQLQKLIMNLL